MAESAKIQFAWKRRPSEIKGFDRAMYTTLDNGDYIRVDYNIVDNIARVYVEVEHDRNSPYYAIINNGRVTLERNNSGRASKVAEMISSRAEQFSSIPNKEILKIVNRNYGIVDRSSTPQQPENRQGQISREQIKKRYFKEEANPYSESASKAGPSVFSRFSLVDFIDFLIGVVITGGFFILFQYSLLAAGAAAVFWGLALGFIDIMLRNREPVFSKIVFFLFGGAFAYLYGYFYY